MKQSIQALKVFERLFGNDFALNRLSLSSFPFVYSNSFDVYHASGTFDFIYVVPKSGNIPTDLMCGVYHKCQVQFQKRIILYLYDSSNSNKKSFIERYISFVSSDGDYRLFEAGSGIASFTINEEEHKESYTKATQLVVNFYLTNKVGEYSVREIAESSGFSISSVSRANAFLHEINALDKNGIGNRAKYKIRSKKNFFEHVKPYLINPIKNRKMIVISKRASESLDGFLSGESALAHYCGLEGPAGFLEVALDKKYYSSLNIRTSESDDASIICYIEEFIYSAKHFARERIISPLDAYIIAYKRYSGNDDPRIEESLKKLERMIVSE